MSDDPTYIAATTLIITIINTLTIIAISPLFSMSIIASNQIGELKKSEESQLIQTGFEEKRKKIGMINKAGIIISVLISPVFFSMFFQSIC